MSLTEVTSIIKVLPVLHYRPSAAPIDLVPAKLLLTIGVADVSIDVMVIQDPAIDGIIVHTLPAGTIDIVVRGQNSSTLRTSA
jgi:hypothetical protein